MCTLPVVRFHGQIRGKKLLLCCDQATLVKKRISPLISTDELHHILRQKTATVFAARSYREYADSHISGAISLATDPFSTLFPADVGPVKQSAYQVIFFNQIVTTPKQLSNKSLLDIDLFLNEVFNKALRREK